MTEPAIQLKLEIDGYRRKCQRCFGQSWRVPRKLGRCPNPECRLAFAPEEMKRPELWRNGALADVGSRIEGVDE